MSTMNVPVVVGICVVVVCSFYYYKKIPSTYCKKTDTKALLKPNTATQQFATQKQEQKEKQQDTEQRAKVIPFDDQYELKKIPNPDKDNYMLYGCLEKNSNKIIGRAVVAIVDGGYTAFLLDLSIDPHHVTNDVHIKLCQYAMDSSVEHCPSIERFRSTKFHDKIGFETLETVRFIHVQSHFVLNVFSQRLNQIDGDNKTNDIYNEYLSNFEQMYYRDIDNIICILCNYYRQTDIFIEWKLFDLNINNHLCTEHGNDDTKDDKDLLDGEYQIISNKDADEEKEEEEEEEDEEKEIYTEKHTINVGIQSIQYFKSYLFDEMSTDCIKVYGINTNDLDQEHGALCFEYRNTKVRPHSTLYHIFGNNEMALLCMVNKCYVLWKNTIYHKDNMETIDFFLNADIVGTKQQLRWLFTGCDTVSISQMDIMKS